MIISILIRCRKTEVFLFEKKKNLQTRCCWIVVDTRLHKLHTVRSIIITYLIKVVPFGHVMELFGRNRNPVHWSVLVDLTERLPVQFQVFQYLLQKAITYTCMKRASKEGLRPLRKEEHADSTLLPYAVPVFCGQRWPSPRERAGEECPPSEPSPPCEARLQPLPEDRAETCPDGCASPAAAIDIQ